MEKFETAVIILNYKCHKDTEKCVDQLLKLGVQADLVIVDNDSGDGSFENLQNCYRKIPNVYVMQTDHNGGYSYGNNAGIREAERISPHRFLAIMNPDVFLSENIFPVLIGKLKQDPRCAAISGKMILSGRTDIDEGEIITWRIPTPKDVYLGALKSRVFRDKRPQYKRIDDRYVRTELLPGSFFVIKKDIFQKIGWFDEGEFLYNEENILGIKLKRLHLYCLIDTDVSYEHRHVFGYGHSALYNYQHNFKKILNTEQQEYESRAYLCRRYYHGRYGERLWAVHRINMAVMYIKYIAAACIGIFYRPGD